MKRQISLNKVMERIEQADEYEISEIIKAIIHRYDRVCTDWEGIFLCLPKNDQEERNKQLNLMVDFLRKHSWDGEKQ